VTTTPTPWPERITDPRLTVALRVVAYAEHHANEHGHTPLTTGELLRAVDPTGFTSPSVLSRAIRAAVRDGWLHHCSSARCLVLARGVPYAPCPATHRGEQ
jgi:hypothetical protein